LLMAVLCMAAAPQPAGSDPASASGGGSTVRCARPDVVVSLGTGDAGVGHRSVVLVFTNRASTPCRMGGYSGVAGLDAGGAQVAQAQRTLNRYLGGVAAGTPPRVTLTPGSSRGWRIPSGMPRLAVVRP
jgi:hypothetical protein